MLDHPLVHSYPRTTNSTLRSLTAASITAPGNAIISCNQSESGNYTVTVTATSGSLSHTTMITVEWGSGSAGGVVLPDDKLRLLLDYIPTLSLIPVVLAVGTVGLWRSKRRRENRALFSMAARTVIFCHILEGSFGHIDLFRQLLSSSPGYSGYLWRSHRAQ